MRIPKRLRRRVRRHMAIRAAGRSVTLVKVFRISGKGVLVVVVRSQSRPS